LGDFVLRDHGGSLPALRLMPAAAIQWPNGKGPPADRPQCGFDVSFIHKH